MRDLPRSTRRDWLFAALTFALGVVFGVLVAGALNALAAGPPMVGAPVFIPEPTSWLTAIAQVGFPIVVSSYLLWMFDKRLAKIANLLARMSEILKLSPEDGE